jgi:predicted Zn finger-like uncharacterized protein
MPFLTNCPSCSRQLRVPDELTGRNVKCPDCGTVFPAGAGQQPLPQGPIVVSDVPPLDSYNQARQPRTADRERARQLVAGPAIALIVVSVLHLLAFTYGLVQTLNAMGNPQAARARAEAMLNQQGPPRDQEEKEARKMMADFAEAFAGPLGLLLNGTFFGLGILTLIGSISMLRLRSHGLAMTACILAVIPCISPCCLLGIPFGIWGLVSLGQPEVREALAHRTQNEFADQSHDL